MREAAGERLSAFEDVPSAMQPQQRPAASYSTVGLHQQETALPNGGYHCPSTPLSSRSPQFQPPPRHWPMNPPPATVWRSQECGYVEQANQQFNVEQQQHQQQQFHNLQTVSNSSQNYIPSADDNNNTKTQ